MPAWMGKSHKSFPLSGVYYSRVITEDREYKGISNVGCKPTVSDENVMGVETYLYGFTGTIYGKTISVQLLSFRRPEQRFDSVESLKAQLAQDIAAGENFVYFL